MKCAYRSEKLYMLCNFSLSHNDLVIEEFLDFDEVISGATSLYPYGNVINSQYFYPTMTFTCSGSITKVSFIVGNENSLRDIRFNTWRYSFLTQKYYERDHFDVNDATVVKETDRYRMYELYLSYDEKISFESGDVLGISTQDYDGESLVHQKGGGSVLFSSYRPNDQTIDFIKWSLLTGVEVPLVTLETGKNKIHCAFCKDY